MCSMESQAKLQRVSSYATGLGKVSPTEIPHVMSTDEKYIRDCYEFGRELGKGSFGVVWEIQHRETKERFACKIIAKDKVLLIWIHVVKTSESTCTCAITYYNRLTNSWSSTQSLKMYTVHVMPVVAGLTSSKFADTLT